MGQNSINEVLQEEIGELKKENAELKIQVDALESRINEVHPICPIKKSNVFSIEGRVKGGLNLIKFFTLSQISKKGKVEKI